jgi:gliding motility-associated-like protein
MKKIFILSLLFCAVYNKSFGQFAASLSGDPLDTAGWNIGGDATIVDSTIQLTTAVTGQSGYVYYNTPVNLTTCAQFTVDFDFKIVVSPSSTVADGIAFWYISNPPSGFATGGGIGLPSYPHGLIMIMDTYDNVGYPIRNPKETLLYYDGTVAGYVEGSSTGLLSPVINYQYFIDDGSWHHCKITYNSGTIKTYFNYSTTPSMTGTYVLTINGYFGFSSSTGANYSTQSVKNIHIDAVGLSGPPTVADSVVTYCQNEVVTDTLVAAPTPGNPLFWYTTDTATVVSLPGSPIPSTTTPGITWYYVRQGAGSCLSNPDSIKVIVNPQPTPIVISGDTVYCEGDAFIPFTVTGDSVLWYTTLSGTGSTIAPVVNTAIPGTYTYYAAHISMGCASTEDSITIVVHNTPVTPTFVSGDTTYCQYYPFVPITVSGSNILWYSTPAGGTGLTSGPVVNTSVPGTYNFYVTQTDSGCKSARLHITVTVYPKPPVPTVSPVIYCENATAVPLTAGGTSLTWYGPGITPGSAVAPTPSTMVPGAYDYYVTQTVNGCLSDSSTLIVVIDTTPTLTASSNSPICQGSDLDLFSNSTRTGVTYSWTNSSSFTSTEQNPVITGAPSSATGLYVVTARLGICTFSQNVEVVVDSIPVLTSIGIVGLPPICSGTNVQLFSNFTPSFGGIYNWSGPLGFTSGVQDPTVFSVPTTASGVYSVTETVAICTSAVYTVAVTVDSTPQVPDISSNSPVCQGDTLKLFSSDSTAGVTYSWTSSTGYTSALQNPVILDVPVSDTGNYIVTVTLGGNCSNSAVTAVSVTPTPSFRPTSNSPVCSGDTLFMYANAEATATYTWTGPYPYLFTTYVHSANPLIPDVTTESSGIYTVTAFYQGCATSETDTVVIKQTPPPPYVSWLTYCQYYPAPAIMANDTGLTWYIYDSLTSVQYAAAPVPSTSLVGSTFYYVSQTVNGCTSTIDSIQVTVNPTPTVTVTPSDTSVCPNTSYVLQATDTDAIAYYHWYPSIYLSAANTPAVTVSPETNVTYTVVASNQYGCGDTATASVTIHPAALIYLPDSVTLYPGEVYSISPSTNCTSFNWFPPAGLSNSVIPDPVASPAVSTRYIVYGQTVDGCTTSDSININISANSLLAVPNAFTPGSSANNEFKIIKRGEASLNYFRIFNRWGQKVFETTNMEAGWDGSFNGTPQPFDVYIYEIEAVTSNGKNFVMQGNVTLVR